MKKWIYILLFLLIGFLLLFMFESNKDAKKIYVDKKQSFYLDYKVENDKVFIECYITLINEFNTEKVVNLSAVLPDEVTIGLLKNEEIKAINEDGGELEFVLPSTTSKSFDVVFTGEYACTNQKHDRHLPEIRITIVN